MVQKKSESTTPDGESDVRNQLRVIVVAPHYRTFIQGLFDALARHVGKVDVIVYRNVLAEIAGYAPFGGRFSKIRKYSIRNIIEDGERPENVNIIIVKGYRGLFRRDTVAYCTYVGKKMNTMIRKRKLHFDLVHSHFAWPWGFVGNMIALQNGVPHVITGHGFDVYSLPFKDERWRAIMKSIFDKADQITTVSKSNMRCLEKLEVSRPTSLITNGFSGRLFYKQDMNACREKLGLPLDRKIILSVGNIIQVKGYIHLIEAFEKLSKSRNDVMCVIVGSGELEGEISSAIRARDMQDRIILTGERPHSEIPLWMNSCNIFCLPSLSEGNPTVLFESLACGKPYVGSDVGGIPDIITSDDYGFLCRPGDSIDLADKLNRGIGKRWNEDSIIAYSKSFNWDRIAIEYSRIYKIATSNYRYNAE